MFLVCPKCLCASSSVRKRIGFRCSSCQHAWEAPSPEFSEAYYRNLDDLELSLVANNGDRTLVEHFPAILGRDSEFKPLLENSAISRQHFRIDRSDNGFTVADLASRLGTYLNAKQIPGDQAQNLNAGDIICVSGVELCVELRLAFATDKCSEEMPGPEVISLDSKTNVITVGGMLSNADVRLPLAHDSSLAGCFFRAQSSDSWRILAFHTGRHLVNGRPFIEHSLAAEDEISIGGLRYVYESGKSCLRPCHPASGLALSTKGICFSVESKQGRKRILNSLSVDIPPGKLTAIIGASGSGKTTLVKILSGLLQADEGEIRLDGERVSLGNLHERMDGKVGFVPQDDIVHDELSVRQAMDFAASLRLSAQFDSGQRTEIIIRVLKELELLGHQEKLVRQLSGGQRKRLNVAVELISAPPLLFLDEPTTGLDAGAERELVQSLRRLANQGRTIVVVTHSLSILHAVDHVVMLADDGSGGRVLAQGSGDDLKKRVNFEDWSDLFRRGRPERSVLSPIIRGHNLSRSAIGLPQTAALFLRYLNVWIATPVTTAFSLLILPLILGFLIRVALPLDGMTGTDRMLFGVICALWVGLNQTVREIVKEKNIMLRENFAGVGCVPYLLAKLLFFLLIGAIQSMVLLAPMVWLRVQGASLNFASADMACSIRLLWLVFWLALAVGSCLGLLISALTLFLRSKGEIVAVLSVVLVMLPQILFSEKVLGSLTENAEDYRSFVITDSSRAAAEIGSYFSVSRYLYLPLAAANRSVEGVSGIFVFNLTILLAFASACVVLAWATLEIFIWTHKKASHW